MKTPIALVPYCFIILLTGCVSYTPKPLPMGTAQVTQALHTADSKTLLIDPSKPLNANDLAAIAVLNNPDLKALRAGQGVADAQVFSAGLLPDPQLNPSWGFPLQSNGNVTAYTYGVNFDIGSLLTRHTQIEAAEALKQQVHDNIAWQEWLVANQAHLLALQVMSLQAQLALAQQNLSQSQKIMQLTKTNLLKHDTTLTEWNARETAYFDAEDQVTTLTRSLSTDQIALNQLLGFPPDAQLQLAPIQVQIPASLNATTLFAQAEKSRLDLQALQAGYQNQEVQVHQAILGQYPHFNLDVNRARDNTDVNSVGLGFTFDLPLWNRNQGQIAIQTATRNQLYQAYISRLQQTRADITTLVANIDLLQTEQKTLLEANGNLTEPALNQLFQEGQIDLATYADFNATLVNKQQRLLALSQSLAEQCVALQIAVGTQLAGLSC